MGDEFQGVWSATSTGPTTYTKGRTRGVDPSLRDIHQLKEWFPEHEGLAGWAERVREVYDQAQAYPGPDPGLPETVQRAQRVKQQQRISGSYGPYASLTWAPTCQ